MGKLEKGRLSEIVKELQGASKMHLKQSKEIDSHIKDMESPLEKKDACYHKVKSRYKVWPSAYASGALVQCRKKGAKNWGNKSGS